MISLKNQNAISIIKTSLIVISCILTVIPPSNYIPKEINGDFLNLLRMFVFGAFAIPFLIYLCKIFIKLEISKPKWTDNPFKIFKPLIAWQFISITAICQGVCMIIKDLIYFGFVPYFSAKNLAIGLGTFAGIYITLWISGLKRKNIKN
jgi:hypothetical protein